LYSLALDGPTTRGVLAERLWGHFHALENLRSELSYLRSELLACGLKDVFARGQDPLQLPLGVVLSEVFCANSVPLDALESGFEELTDGFVAWVEEHRRRLLEPRVCLSASRAVLVRSVAAQLTSRSGVLFVSGLPGAGLSDFVHELARVLRLPFVEGLHSSGPVLHWLPAPHPAGTFDRILESKSDVFVLEQPVFGEVPQVLLELEHRLPASQVLKLSLPGLSWSEARTELLSNLCFSDAARAFLETQGQPDALHEYVAFASLGTLQQPSRMLGAFQRELRFLELPCRLALERLSVHPGPLCEALIEALDAAAHTDELERLGWLRFETHRDRACWSFRHELTRRALYAQLQPGRRHHAHTRAMDFFVLQADVMAKTYHQVRAGLGLNPEALLEACSPWQRVMLRSWLEPDGLVELGSSQVAPETGFGTVFDDSDSDCQFLEPFEHDLTSTSFERHADGFVVVRSAASGIERLRFEPNPKAMLLSLRLRAHLESPLQVGLSGFAFPLRLVLSDGRKFGFCAIDAAFEADGTTWLKLSDQTEMGLVLPAGVGVQLEVGFETGVLEVDLRLSSVSALPQTATDLLLRPSEPEAYPLLLSLDSESTSKAV
jgi:hypothetical protein